MQAEAQAALARITNVFVEGTEGYHTFRMPAIVTTPKGSVLAFCEGRVGRHDHSENDILLKRSEDGGRSWSPLEDVPALVEPECMGSIIRIGDARDGSGALLFSNPVSTSDRINGSVRISRDDGATWSAPKTICGGRFAYSCLAVLPDDRVGCLYETGRTDPYERIVLACFPLAWIDGS